MIALGLAPAVLFFTAAFYYCHEALDSVAMETLPAEAAASESPPLVASEGPAARHQGMLLLIALMCLNNILPQSRQFLHDVTGVSPVALGLAPAVLFFTAAFYYCHE